MLTEGLVQQEVHQRVSRTSHGSQKQQAVLQLEEEKRDNSLSYTVHATIYSHKGEI